MNQFLSKKTAVIVTLVSLVVLLLIVVRVKTAPTEPLIEATPETSNPKHEVIGTSVEGRNIEAYTYLPARLRATRGQAPHSLRQAGGKGEKHLLFVGGMHGGYEWNSVLLAYKLIDHLDTNPDFIPEGMKLSVIPSLNPDGVYAVVGSEGRFNATDASTNDQVLASGRFNANSVDLNRNFDCKWKPKSMWRSKTVSAGTAPFSEPETRALRDFVLNTRPDAVIFWHSQSNAVYASECEKGILQGTLDIMNAYSRASGYPPVKTFDAYEITGDSEGWLASIGIPAITVELKTHEMIEWDKNLAGMKALLDDLVYN